jgi:hypothetical protein
MVRPEVRDHGSRPTGRCGSNHAVSLLEWALQLDTDLEANVAVPVDGNMATALCLLRACTTRQTSPQHSGTSFANWAVEARR